jgi:thioredoxin-like negative regulator of GroEL
MAMSLSVVESTRIEELRRRVLRDPASVAFAALAEEYRRLGRFGDAIDTCRAGLLRHPSYQSARVTLGRALIDTGDFDAAAAELDCVLRAAPENLAAIRALAEIHRRRADMPETVESYGFPAMAMPSPPSQPVPVAVQSFPVSTPAPDLALSALESFLGSIQRARRDASLSIAR